MPVRRGGTVPAAPTATGAPFVRLAPGRRLAVVPVTQAPSLAVGAGTGKSMVTLSDAGAPLPPDVRERLEAGLGAELGAVRVHQGEGAARLARGHAARAFAFGHHVVLGAGESPRDLALMAHEVAHVLQQRGAPAVQRCGGGVCTCGGACGGGSRSGFEAEAARAASAVSSGGSYAVTGQTGAVGAQYEGEEEGFLESTLWGMLDQFAPTLASILRKGPTGVFDWVKEKVSGAVQSLIDTAMAPVRTIAATGQSLHAYFAPLLTSMQEAASRIAQNDCKPITDAAAKIEDVATKFITPIIEKIQFVANKVGDFLKGVWQKFGLPVWEFIKANASMQWEQLKSLAEWIWDKAKPIRDFAARAWTWLKNKIGIGEGPEGQNGILQWVQAKAGAAWDWVQAKIEPYKKQITAVATVVGGIALMVSPAGPVILAGAAIYGVIEGVKWIRANLAGGNAIVRARVYAQTVLIPKLMGAIGKMTAAVTRMATAVSGKLGEFAAGLGRVVGAAASTALQFLVDAAQWLAEKAVELATWATEKLGGLADWIQKGLARLQAFLQPVLNFFVKVGNLLVDIYGLPLMLAGELWKKIPACIRDPFVDWIIPLILRQIEIFQELVKNDEAWAKTKADVMNIIRLVFVTKDLKGAIRATFDLILRMFNLPMELLVQVWQKAQAAWDTVSKKPIEFIKNTARTLGRALLKYWDKLSDNLLYGLEGWLFGEVAEKGIQKPNSWTDPWDIFQLALDVMGLSMAHIFELLEKRFEKTTVDRLRVAYRYISRAWNWIMDIKDKKPGEVTKEIIQAGKDFAKSILEGIVSWIIEQIGVEIAEMATAAAASAGLSEVLDVIRRIWRAIKAVRKYARQIVDMINKTLDTVLDIAAGRLAGPAEIFHGALKKATPAVIGFLSYQVGLGGVGDEIRSLVDKLRKKVDDAILAVIDALRSFFGALVQGAKNAVGKLLDWWKEKRKPHLADGKEHTLSFTAAGGGYSLILATEPRPVQDHLAEVESDADFDEGTKKAARNALTFWRTNIEPVTAKAVPNPAPPKEQAMIDALPDNLTKLSDMLMKVGEGSTKDLPGAASWSNLAPKGRSVERLTQKTARGGTGTNGQSPPGWDAITDRGLTERNGRWVRMHLIAAAIGGHATPENLIPAPGAVNTGTVRNDFEKKVERLIFGDENPRDRDAKPSVFRQRKGAPVVWATAKVDGFYPAFTEPGSTAPLYGGAAFATGVQFEAGIHYLRGKDWPKDVATIQLAVPLDRPDFSGDFCPNINSVGRDKLASLARISEHVAGEIVHERGGTPAVRAHTSLGELRQRMRKYRQDNNVAVTPELLGAFEDIQSAITAKRIKWKG